MSSKGLRGTRGPMMALLGGPEALAWHPSQSRLASLSLLSCSTCTVHALAPSERFYKAIQRCMTSTQAQCQLPAHIQAALLASSAVVSTETPAASWQEECLWIKMPE